MILHSAADLGAAVRDLRPDATALVEITDAWCALQMRRLGTQRYEHVTDELLHRIADRVDSLVLPTAAAALGRLGGSVRSERKTAAVRENGKKGGRPITRTR